MRQNAALCGNGLKLSNISHFNDSLGKDFEKYPGKSKKMLVTRIFSHSTMFGWLY